MKSPLRNKQLYLISGFLLILLIVYPFLESHKSTFKEYEATYTANMSIELQSPLRVIPHVMKRLGVIRKKSAYLCKLANTFEQDSVEKCGYLCQIECTDSWSSLNYDMTIFHILNFQRIPPQKRYNQLWVFLAPESPRTLGNIKLSNYNGLFNYTLTYLRTTEPRLMFGTGVIKRTTPTQKNFAVEKKKMLQSHHIKHNALWFVSDCRISGLVDVRSGRTEYVLKLSEYIAINVFSKSDSLCYGPLLSLIRDPYETSEAYKDYAFYLAFENTLCKDYITEKFWKILFDDGLTIPVVLGGTDIEQYERVAPPNSFIHVKNFTSPRALAQHLHYVASSDEAFNYYHEWRNHYWLEDDPVNGEKNYRQLCHFCMLAHTRPYEEHWKLSKEYSMKSCHDPRHDFCSYYGLHC